MTLNNTKALWAVEKPLYIVKRRKKGVAPIRNPTSVTSLPLAWDRAKTYQMTNNTKMYNYFGDHFKNYIITVHNNWSNTWTIL